MVSEACQDTGHVYTSYSGYGDITIQSNDCDAPIGTLITITDPWSNNHTDQIMAIGTIKTFVSGSEVYTVEMTDMFCGVETTWSDYTECWYTDDGNRYVKTGGLDSAIGNNWANAWKTNGYGFQNIPSGKDLYVEEGYYGDETLSNLNPPQTMKMYIQPEGHTEAACEVHVFEHSVLVSNVDEDSWTKSTSPDSNFNGDSYLRIGVPSGQTRYSHLQFDISSLPSSPSLYSAVMRIYVVYESNRAIELRKESSTFDETTITWNNKPASTNSTITQVITETGWIDLDITAILTAAFGDSTLGIEIRPTSSSESTFGRHESGYGASLIIQYD